MISSSAIFLKIFIQALQGFQQLAAWDQRHLAELLGAAGQLPEEVKDVGRLRNISEWRGVSIPEWWKPIAIFVTKHVQAEWSAYGGFFVAKYG